MKSILLFLSLFILISCSDNKEKNKTTNNSEDNALLVNSDTINAIEDLEDFESDDEDLSNKMASGPFIHLFHEIQICYSSDNLDMLEFEDSLENDLEGYIPRLSESQFNSLSTKEALIYCLIYPEDFEQICAEPPSVEPGKLYPYLSFDSDGEMMSDRQFKFIKDNRDEVLNLIVACIKESSFSDDYYEIFYSLGAYEHIPFLIETYEEGAYTDNYILTLLINLMEKKEYEPFRKWVDEVDLWAYEETDEEEDDLDEFFMDAYMFGITLTDDKRDKILSFVRDFYNEIEV